MKYKNVSNKVKMLKVNGEFVNVQPGDEVDLPNYVSEESLEEVVGEALELKKPKKRKVVAAKIKAKKKDPKSKEELDSMTKDQLNDYAAKNGLDKVSSRMKKDDMVKAILKHQKK